MRGNLRKSMIKQTDCAFKMDIESPMINKNEDVIKDHPRIIPLIISSRFENSPSP